MAKAGWLHGAPGWLALALALLPSASVSAFRPSAGWNRCQYSWQWRRLAAIGWPIGEIGYGGYRLLLAFSLAGWRIFRQWLRCRLNGGGGETQLKRNLLRLRRRKRL